MSPLRSSAHKTARHAPAPLISSGTSPARNPAGNPGAAASRGMTPPSSLTRRSGSGMSMPAPRASSRSSFSAISSGVAGVLHAGAGRGAGASAGSALSRAGARTDAKTRPADTHAAATRSTRPLFLLLLFVPPLSIAVPFPHVEGANPAPRLERGTTKHPTGNTRTRPRPTGRVPVHPLLG